MIKGVNKQVLEVTQPEQECFEKVVFFVKSDFAEKDDEKILKKAKEYACGNVRVPKNKLSGFSYAVFALCSAVGGAIGAAIVNLII